MLKQVNPDGSITYINDSNCCNDEYKSIPLIDLKADSVEITIEQTDEVETEMETEENDDK